MHLRRHRQLEERKNGARFYVLGQAASWIGLLLFGMLMLDFLPYHFILLEAIPLGLSVDALLLALALGDRIRILQNAKQMAEDAARRSLETRKEEWSGPSPTGPPNWRQPGNKPSSWPRLTPLRPF